VYLSFLEKIPPFKLNYFLCMELSFMKKFFLLSFTSLLLAGAVYAPLEAMQPQEPALTPAPRGVGVQIRDLSQDVAPDAGRVAPAGRTLTQPAPKQKPYLDVLQEELDAALQRGRNFDPKLQAPYTCDLTAGKQLRALSFLHINEALPDMPPVLMPLIVSYLSTLGNDIYFFAQKAAFIGKEMLLKGALIGSDRFRKAGYFGVASNQFEWPVVLGNAFVSPFDSIHRYAAELGCVDAGMGLAVESLAGITQAPAWNDNTYNLYIRCLEVGSPHDIHLMDRLRKMLTFPQPSGETPEAREIRIKRASELEALVRVAKKKDRLWNVGIRYYNVQWENGRAEHEENLRRYLPAAAAVKPAA
jgi:hypothetical protein